MVYLCIKISLGERSWQLGGKYLKRCWNWGRLRNTVLKESMKLWEHTAGAPNPALQIRECFLEEEHFQFILKGYGKIS